MLRRGSLYSFDQQLQLTTGSRLGPYEIIEPLGTGGMGEVYRARDTRLERSVAIKVIAAGNARDSSRQIRFDREARAISNLNHPNICALYDIGTFPGEHGDRQYIVMEYLDGETLQDRLVRGAMPVELVLRHAIEIAGAIETAHRQQILHRDLKPSNIMLTPTGACLFDFGLAKFFEPPRPSTAETALGSPTPEKPITMDGSIVGTPEYLAPEQLEGHEPDGRTDIYAFGICLYQMITGRKPFQGNTRATLLAAILDGNPPPVTEIQPSTPPALAWLIGKCLHKDPNERMQSMHDVKLELMRISDDLQRPAATQGAVSTARWWIYSSAVTAALLVITAVVLVFRPAVHPAPTIPERHFTIALPAAAPIAEGAFDKLAVSPDGVEIVYVGGNEPTRLYLYSTETQETKVLPGTEGARGPFFSPDGQWIGFYTVDEGLKKIPVSGGAPVVLSANRDLRGATWGADDTIVFAEPSSALQRISASGGRPEPLFTLSDPKATYRWPSSFGSGKELLYTIGDFSGTYENARLAVWSPNLQRGKVVLDRATYGRYVPGFLVYLHSRTVFAVPFDKNAMKITGAPIPITSDVDSYFSAGLAHFAVSSDGSMFYIPDQSSQSPGELVWVNRSGKETPVTAERRAYKEVKISPDGTRLLLTIGQASRQDLWVYDLSRGSWMRLTSTGTNQQGIWSPDGREIAFASNETGGFGVYVTAADGSTPAKLIVARKGWDFPWSWSPDGTGIAVTEYNRPGFNDILLVAPKPGAIPTPLIATYADERDPAISPDGHWIAYRSDDSGRDEIYVAAFPSSGRKWLISNDGGTNPVWRKDSRELFYRNGDKMMAVAISTNPEFTAGRPHLLFAGPFQEHYDVTPDGQHFVMAKRSPQPPRTQIDVIVGLFGNLRNRRAHPAR